MKKLFVLISIALFSISGANAQPHWKMLTTEAIPTRCIDVKDGSIYVGVAGSNNSGFIRTSDQGTNWTSVSPVFDEQNVYSMALGSPVQYVGTGKGLYSSFDNGASWNKEVLSTGDFLVYEIATRGNETFAATQIGLQYRPNDETIWKRIGIYSAHLAYVTDVKIAGDTVFACDISYGVQFSTDAGSTWKMLYCKNAKSYTSISYSDGNLFVGTDAGAYYWDRTSDTLSQIFSGKSIYSVASLLGNVFISTNDGVYHAKNYGRGWWEFFDADSVVLTAYDLKVKDYVLYAASFYGAYSTDIAYLSIGEENPETEICISPNPATDRISISAPVIGRVYQVINAMGESVAKAQASSAEALNIDVSALQSGVYFVTDGSGFSTKFVKE